MIKLTRNNTRRQLRTLTRNLTRDLEINTAKINTENGKITIMNKDKSIEKRLPGTVLPW
jgi:hypothetical protein